MLPRSSVASVALICLFGLPVYAASVEVFYIGVDNNTTSDFDPEWLADDHYYWEDGDYSGLGTGGGVWSEGRPELTDDDGGPEGFDRALTTSQPTNFVYFQLTPKEAIPTAKFSFVADMINANGDHHIISYQMNGTEFHEENGIGAKFVSDTFTGADVGATPGPNYVRITKTNPDGWNQFDYLSLEVTAPQLAATPGDGSLLDFGLVSLGSVATSPFSLENVGTAGSTIDITSAVLTGADAGLFSLPVDPTGTQLIGDDGPMTFDVEFAAPLNYGSFDATLTLQTLDENGLASSIMYDLAAVAVPEPTSMALSAFAVLGLAVGYRRKRRCAASLRRSSREVA
jgi:hypothetical protein